MPQSIQPSAIDDSFDYTPTMSWTRPAQQVEYQHYVEPGDARSAIDDRCKTEYGFVPDRPSFPVRKDTKNLARNLGGTIIESKKTAAVVGPAKSKPAQTEAVQEKSTTPKPSSRPRPVHRYKHIIIRGKDGQTDIRRNPFRIPRDASKTPPPTPAPDPPKLEDKAITPIPKSSSSSGKQKVRIVGKDGQERIMKLSMPLRYDDSTSVTQKKSVKPTASAPVVEKRHATPVKVDQMSHTPRQDESSKRAQRQQPQYQERPTEAKKNTNVKNEEKVVTNAQNSRTKAATEPPRRSQPPVSKVISEVKPRDSVSVRMPGAKPISSRNSKVHSVHDSGVAFGSANTSTRGSATSKDTSKVHSAQDSGIGLGSANTSARQSATSKDTSKSSRSSSLPTNKTSSMICYPGGGKERFESLKKDDIPAVPSQSKTSKTSHKSTKSPSTSRDGLSQTSQSTIQSYHEWTKSLTSSRSSKHHTVPHSSPSIKSESFAGSSRNGGTAYARPGDITPHPLSVCTHDMSDRQPPQFEPAWGWDNRAMAWGSQTSHHTGMLSHEPPSSRGSMASGQSRSKHSFIPSTVPDIDSWDRASQTPTIPFGEPGYVASAHGSGSRMTHRQPTVESVDPTPLPHDESNQHEFWFDGGSSTPQSQPQPRWAGNRPSQVEIPQGYERTDPTKPSPLLHPYPYHYLDPFKTNTEGVRRQMRAREGKTGSRVDQLRHSSDTPKP